jgi:GMP synthase-like glutamine amidotransferase
MAQTQIEVIQHHCAESAGEILHWAQSRDIKLQVYRADLAQLPAPNDLPCIILGGPYSALGNEEWLRAERAWLSAKIKTEAKIFAICLGAQLLAHASGAQVKKMATPESGWSSVQFLDGSNLDVMTWHEDQFTLPSGGQAAARNENCIQMFRLTKDRLGLQFHPEWNAASLVTLNSYFGDASPLPREIDAEKHATASAWLHTQLDNWLEQKPLVN